ncbi:MAG: MOSC domain-containing protein [Lachnospiraceae bacterium]|uniref:MOSC domain-containing protein n=1 Tax=Candidatus Enterocloster excrementigallinarum TaxID=2838558 RepID=A0A9D2PUP5_9FIRM|nr:MOSC domain-containing protein [Lachnospiraceae bacterium]HJC66578.1 MOSC domain-containing protein [Candidatus Enterocloster excrementigallinarum]
MEKDLKNILARGRVRAICISKERGTEKQAVPEGHFLVDFGIQGDAHAGNWHRQVSLLSYDKVEAFNQRGADVSDGAFGENLVVEDIDFASLPVGTRLCAGTAQLEMTQIGKECHSHCAIYKRMGECIMPREGVFARVIQEGIIRPGDDMTAIAPQEDRPFQAAVITLSDKGARGERKDESGPAAVQLLQEAGYQVAETLLIADEPEVLKKHLIRLADSRQVDLIITSGGTGFSLRDQTPEATLAVADRNAPGIAEAIRAQSMTITNRAMLSRGVSVIRGKTLIINLPGSPKAVKESLGFILESLGHGLAVLRGSATECARS